MDRVSEITRAIRRLEADLRVLREARDVLLRIEHHRPPLDAERVLGGESAIGSEAESQLAHEDLGKVILEVLSDRKPRTLAEFYEEIGRLRPGTKYKHLAGWLARASRDGRLQKVGRGVYRAA